MLEDARALAVIPVHDIDKARTFYEKMLGFKPAEGAGTRQEVMYSVGDTTVLVYQTKQELGGATKVMVVVRDLDKEMSDLRSHGVTFEDFNVGDFKTTNGVVEDDHGKTAWFKDLEGNWIALAEFRI